MEAATLTTSLGFHVDERSEKAFDRVKEHIEGVKRRLEVLAGAEIIRGLFELSERFGSMGEQLESNALAAGLTTTEFQKLTYAAAQNGVSQDEMATGLARLSRALYQARRGAKESVEAFASAGITPEQIASFHTSKDAFVALGDALRGMTDSTQKVAVLQELMGRGSFRLLKFAVQGRDTIRQLGDDAEKMGAVLDDNLVENLAKSEQAMIGFKATTQAVVAELGARFAPNVISVTHALERFWVRNRELIMTRLDNFFYDLGFAIGSTYAAFEILGNGVADFIRKYSAIAEPMLSVLKYLAAASAAVAALEWGWGKLVAAFAGARAVGGFFTAPFGLLISLATQTRRVLSALALEAATLTARTFPALSRAILTLGASIEATPVGVIAAALVALGAAAYTAYEMWNGKSFVDTKLGQFLSWTLDIIGRIAVAFDNLTGKFFSEKVGGFLRGIGNALGTAAGSIGGRAGTAGTQAIPMSLLGAGAAPAPTMPSFVTPMAPTFVSPVTSVAAPRSAPTVSTMSSMPVTINVNGAQQPQAIAAQIQAALSAHQDSLNRSTMSQLQTALEH